MTGTHDGGARDRITRQSSSELTICSKRYVPRRWFDDSTRNDWPTNTVANDRRSFETAVRLRHRSPSVGRSKNTTDLTGTTGGTDDGDAAYPTGRANGGTARERYGPHERAGTFEMITSGGGGGGPAAGYPTAEFAVWRRAGTAAGGRPVLWFTATKKMPPRVAAAVRALEVWTDRSDDGRPSKVVFLRE